MKSKWIGRSVPRKEGRSKVTGHARYVDDIVMPDMLHGATVRSPVARGILKKINFDPSIPWNEFVVVTAADIPGENVVALIDKDQPYLVKEKINHPEEAIVLIAHPDKNWVERARTKITFDIEKLPPVFTIEDALKKSTIIWGQDNLFKSYRVEKGNVDTVWKTAAHVVTGEYFTSAQEQLYIENNGMIAVANPTDGVTVWGSMQCPYYIHKALKPLFNLPAEKIRVVQTETGGGFGGEEEYPSMIAGHAALLSWKAKKPVKLIYDRAEDMVATTKRHPSRTRLKTALDKEGKLLAMEIEFVIDGGAYMTLSPVVLSRGTIHAAGPYLCPNVRINAHAVATNCPPHGAFRGFGAPQSLFALERHMERVAKAAGLNPEDFRRRNFLKKEDLTATQQVIREDVDMPGLLARAMKETQFNKKKKAFAAANKKSSVKKGIGLATFFHGAGFTGSGERMLASIVGSELTKEGKVRVLAANTEIGQGTNTIFSQIAADALGIDYDDIEVATPDTDRVPNSGPTVASRTCMIVGKLVETTSQGVLNTLLSSGLLKSKYSSAEFKKAALAYLKKYGELKVMSQYKEPPQVHWDDKNYKGDAYGAFAWAVYVAEVSVDTVTYETKVDYFTAVQEVGRVIHPLFAEGQIIGGVAQGIGYALYEDVVWKDGKMANNRMTNYIMPTALDTPEIKVIFEENPYAFGPGGAKGIGELPLDGPAPAILNAIEDATGISLMQIPASPERLMRAMHG